MLQMGYMPDGGQGPGGQYMMAGGQGAPGQMAGGDPGMPHMVGAGLTNGDGVANQ